MPPSSLLMTIYSADHGVSPKSPNLSASPIELKLSTSSSNSNIDPENTHPNSNHETSVKITGSEGPPSTVTSHVAPFLEMEQEYDDGAMLKEISLKGDGAEEHKLLLIDIAVLKDEGSTEEEKREEEESCPKVIAKEDSSSLQTQSPSSSVRSRTIDENVISCGKRPRSRRVSFADQVDLNCADLDQQRPIKKSLVGVQNTIHLSEYTPEELNASWYTYDDLKSFKRERKETARHIQNGLLSLPSSSINLPHTSEQTPNGDTYIDSMSSSKPIVYCSRGFENCIAAVSRIRYCHIANGWRAVFNTQRIHKYERQKLTRMSSFEKDQFNALASFLGSSSKKKLSRRYRSFQGTPNGSNSSSNNSSGNSSEKDPYDNLCCPYELAAAYRPSSEASLHIARSRAINDERDVADQNAQDQQIAVASEIDDGKKHILKNSVERIRNLNDNNSITRLQGRRESARRRIIDI